MSDQGSLFSFLEGISGDHHFLLEYAYDGPAPNGWGLRNRVIDRFHMASVRSGRGTYTIEGHEEEFAPGNVMFVSPFVPHSAWADPSDLPHLQTCRFWLCGRDGEPVSQLETSFSKGIVVADAGRYRQLFGDLFRQYSTDRGKVAKRHCNAILTQIICELAGESSPRSPKDPSLEVVRREIWNKPQLRRCIDDLAHMAGLSRKTFTQRFLKQFGCPPGEYQIRVRCEQAKHQLLETSSSIKQIALNLGYPDTYTFSKQFKKVKGFSPSSLRKA